MHIKFCRVVRLLSVPTSAVGTTRLTVDLIFAGIWFFKFFPYIGHFTYRLAGFLADQKIHFIRFIQAPLLIATSVTFYASMIFMST